MYRGQFAGTGHRELGMSAMPLRLTGYCPSEWNWGQEKEMDKWENPVMPDWALPLLFGCFATLTMKRIWDLVRNRRSLVACDVTHDRPGISTCDNIHGEVSVLPAAPRCRIDTWAMYGLLIEACKMWKIWR